MYTNGNVLNEMQLNHEKSLTALNAFCKLCDDYLTENEIPDNDLADVTMFMLAKFYKTLLAFRLLIVSGFEEDASILLRTLLENLINLVYISEKPQDRIKLFIEFDHIIRKRILDRFERNYPEEVIDDNVRNSILQNYELVKDNYKPKTSWRRMDIMTNNLEDTQAKYWYDIVYSIESSYVHSNVRSSLKLIQKLDGKKVVKVGQFPFKATDIISKSIELTRGMLLQVTQNWSMDSQEIINAWEKSKLLIDDEFSR
ncbi:hypothetical protein E4K67_22295 [Desulfosporosinus fructosivorans]|uniref:Uncharacterized protein n=1 Tax=Desulfosporosinus fructosivorans TaxID=2018669 RepID=A0A4Z0QYJ4_9FIRM|nr:DUF5677 domain-containing protein [Desulfosporosinus fructosivorans]TGE35852.1 hypothetical protein E4K67_22295 [Desulfosporosinus fructosivorans]